MEVIFILIGVSLIVALFFLGAFIWAMKKGQFDDDTTPAMRMLFDSETQSHNQKVKNGS